MIRKKIAAVFLAIITYFGAFGLCGVAQSVTETAVLPQLKVVVDAGHGGMDGGVVGTKTGIKESDLNLTIAFKIKEKLTDAGFEVVMTRKTEAGLYGEPSKGFKGRDMQKRKEIAEAAFPTLLLSVHQNFYPSSRQRGGQIFYLAESEQGAMLAAELQNGLNALYGGYSVKARNAMKADYFMLRFPFPSVIVECGFLSSPKDETLLVEAVFQEKLAAAIAAGVVRYMETQSG